MSTFLYFIDILWLAFTLAIITRVILSRLNLRPDNYLMTALYEITEPILSPLRRIFPRVGTIDITPIVAIIILFIIIAPLHIII